MELKGHLIQFLFLHFSIACRTNFSFDPVDLTQINEEIWNLALLKNVPELMMNLPIFFPTKCESIMMIKHFFIEWDEIQLSTNKNLVKFRKNHSTGCRKTTKDDSKVYLAYSNYSNETVFYGCKSTGDDIGKESFMLLQYNPISSQSLPNSYANSLTNNQLSLFHDISVENFCKFLIFFYKKLLVNPNEPRKMTTTQIDSNWTYALFALHVSFLVLLYFTRGNNNRISSI